MLPPVRPALAGVPAARRDVMGDVLEALVLSRPPHFTAGTAPIRLEAVVSQVFGVFDLKVETALGGFLIRLPELVKPGTTGAEAAFRPMPGDRLAMILSPLGTIAQIVPAERDPVPAAAPAPHDKSFAATLAPAVPSIDAPISPGSLPVVSAMTAVVRAESEITHAFLAAGDLQDLGAAERIHLGFELVPQPYRALSEALALSERMLVGRLAAYAPQPNSRFGLSLLLFLLNIRQGGLRCWLGLDEGAGDPGGQTEDELDYLEGQIAPRTVHLLGHGEWSVTLAPFAQEHVDQLLWAVRLDGLGVSPPLRVRRFALQMLLPHAGPVQLTGYMNESHLELVLLTVSPILGAVGHRLEAAAAEAFRYHGLEGNLQLSRNTDLWIPFLEALRLDGEI